MKYSYKIGFSALIIVVVLISSMIYATQLLKKEAEQNHLNNTKLHVSNFKDQITQTVSTVNRSIDNITLVINKPELVQNRINTILYEYQFIRSINILDENNTIIYSTNSKNMNQKFSTSEFYPKPMFDSAILRFGSSLNARDLFTPDDILTTVPVVKTVVKNDKNYHIVVALSNDYFINQYSNNLRPEIETLEIIRVDGTILFSTKPNFSQSKIYPKSNLYEKALEKSFSSGIEWINHKKNISSYVLTSNYPLCIVVKFDYEKMMKNWEDTILTALVFISLLIVFISSVIVHLLFKYTRTKNHEIAYKNELIKNQEKLKNAYIVYNNTNDGILITDENINILDVNNAFIRNTGYTKDEVYGKNPSILKSYLHDDEFYDKMWECVNTYDFWNGEIVNKNKDGVLYTELLTINKIYDNNKKVKNYIGVFTNITKEKEQELLIKEKERFIFQQSKMASMGEMLENIAHQWRQPLSVISTAATGIKMEKEFGISKEETEIQRLTLINDSAQFLSQTIDDFRNFFKPEKEKEDFYIEDALEQSLNIVNSKFKNRNIIITKNIESIKITEYKSELVQVIMNLLNNARDVLETKDVDDRFVFIGVYTENNYAKITIKDSGGGVDNKIIDKLFEPYFTTKHQSQGTGIGLYMSEEIIRKHMNGTITVKNTRFTQNQKEYTGAEFMISIPLG
ncbi:MAG: PAS domain-containing sensor histidine kinase [Arcobacteraceae bacterium]